MTELNALRHWIVDVVRGAGLPGHDALELPSDTPSADAWQAAAMATGITTETLAELVAVHFGHPRADFSRTDLAAIPLIPADVAHRLGVLCVGCSDTQACVATADPVSIEAEAEIKRLTSRTVHWQVATPEQIVDTVGAAYPDHDPSAPHTLPALLADEVAPRILVVDDDADTRLLLRTGLQNRGFRVVEAGGGEEALDILAAPDPVHLVTLDLQMEGIDGLEVLEKIRSRLRTRQLPVIVVTGTSDPEVEMALFDAGADDFVVKPIDPPRLLLRVQAVLRRYDRTAHPLLG